MPSQIDTGDTAYVLVSASLVLIMTPGLAFFYGGLVRSRNVLNTMMMSLSCMAIIGIAWVLWGYSLAFCTTDLNAAGFAQGIQQFVGGLDWIFLRTVSARAPDPLGYAPTIPHQLYMVYQMMFAIIAGAIIAGGVVERMNFKAFIWFIGLWSTLVYAPLAHWVWGRGFLEAQGALDFAGGTVVHVSSGVSAFVAAWIIGPRRPAGQASLVPHNVPFVLLGASLLWFGWFGFNAGSALSAGALATVAYVATMVAATAGGLTWLLLDGFIHGKPTAVGLASGFVAGLVGITPAAGYVGPISALIYWCPDRRYLPQGGGPPRPDRD